MTCQAFDVMNAPLAGTSLIEASAGTGKTYTLAALYLRLVLQQGLMPAQILVVTFTEAATAELRGRIRDNLGTALHLLESADPFPAPAFMEALLASVPHDRARTILRRALAGFDEAAVHTIHGFCRRVLADNSFESGLLFDTELITNQQALLQDIADDFWRTRVLTAGRLTAVAAARAHISPESLLSLAHRIVNRPLLRLRPPCCGTAPETLQRAWQEICREWRASESEIRSLLQDTDRFRKDYSNSLDTWIEDVAACVADCPTAARIAAVCRLSQEALDTNIMKKHAPAPCHPFFARCGDVAAALTGVAVCLKRGFADYLRSELPARKQAAGVCSFDDLLVQLREALHGSSGTALLQRTRARFRAALIDEFQDTDPVQYDIFKTIFSPGDVPLFLIGDPKQSIYRFRGADIFAYITAAADTPQERTCSLPTNWRSETAVVEATNHLFSLRDNAFVLGEHIAFRPVAASPDSAGNRVPFTLHGAPAAGGTLLSVHNRSRDRLRPLVVDAVVGEIARLLELAQHGAACLGDRPLQPSDITVLVTRNEDARLFLAPLAARNIPVVLSKSGSVFQSREAAELELLLHAIASPSDTRLRNGALATSFAGLTAGQLARFAESADAGIDEDLHADRFAQYHDLWRTRGVMYMLRTFLNQYDVRSTLLGLFDGDRRLTNLLHLAELIHSAAADLRLSPEGTLRWLACQRTGAGDDEVSELRLERDDEAVRIMTVFKSKGLEFPIVFCPFMWQKHALHSGDDLEFHHDGYMHLDLGPTEGDCSEQAQAERENLAELVRQLYVALTRARSHWYLIWGRIGQDYGATAANYLLAPGTDTPRALVAHYKAAGEADLEQRVAALAAPCPTLRVQAATPQPGPAPAPVQATARVRPAARSFDGPGKIARDWGIASFSGLIAAGPQHAGARILSDEPPTAAAGNGPAEDFFAFPRGPVPGTCIHAIFEALDFSCIDPLDLRHLVHRQLTNYGLADAGRVEESIRTTAVAAMVQRVTQAELVPGVRLQGLPPENCCAELAFWHPLGRIDPQALARALEGPHPVFPDGDIAGRIGRLQFSPIRGYMQGFIDLVFRCGGRYYLLDWKTNHLGNTCADYAAGALTTTMLESGYVLQYHIYTVALHRYLSGCVPDYDYDRHFGGVLYLFVRGIHPDHPGCGIFYDLPERGRIEELNTLCCPA